MKSSFQVGCLGRIALDMFGRVKSLLSLEVQNPACSLVVCISPIANRDFNHQDQMSSFIAGLEGLSQRPAPKASI